MKLITMDNYVSVKLFIKVTQISEKNLLIMYLIYFHLLINITNHIKDNRIS